MSVKMQGMSCGEGVMARPKSVSPPPMARWAGNQMARKSGRGASFVKRIHRISEKKVVILSAKKSYNIMKKATLPLALLALALPLQAQVRVDYEKLSAANGVFTSRFVLHNQSGSSMDGDWNIYFSQLPIYPQRVSSDQVTIEPVLANYFRLSPTDGWTPLASGDSIVFNATFAGDMSRESYAPEGMFIVGKDGKPRAVDFHAKPFATSELTRGVEKNYNQNSRLQASAKLSPTDVFPSVKHATLGKGTCDLSRGIAITADGQLQNEARLLSEALGQRLGIKEKKGGVDIRLRVDNALPSDNEEYYELNVRSKRITITGKSAHAVWNGTRTLLALLRNPLNGGGKMHQMDIKDYPDFAYRGQMIDIARNFMPYEDLLKLVDRLADYKLSVLHLHFCDDEGWRLEIPGLPELTEVGARRGYTTNEMECLHPGYDGSFDPEGHTTGNGYLTRGQFISLLRYAKERHVSVIPEVECPGHARAAIRSMEARYQKYKDTDMAKALQYRLADPNDTSKYSSAQGYHDNVMDPGVESSFTFMCKVIDEVVLMYQEAGAPLPFLHLGGDEVADQVWTGSPSALRLEETKGLKGKEAISSWFYERIIHYMAERQIKFGGWQEIVTRHRPLDNDFMKRQAGGLNLWAAVPEWSTGEIFHEMANAGWPTIMSDVTNCYLDLAYSRHPEERGLQWGGTVDEAVTFALMPFDVYRSMHDSINGNPAPWSVSHTGLLQLKPEAKKNVIGVQGQLWSECIRGSQWVDYQIFPKIIGLMERAWNAVPTWQSLQGEAAEAEYYEQLSTYYKKIAEVEMPTWGAENVNFRLPNPGLKMVEGKVCANSPVGGTIRYTTDGSTPTATSPVYTAPIAVKGGCVKARLFKDGKESVTSALIVGGGKAVK